MTDVSSGSLTLNADGSFLYTPDANIFGNDSFTYTAHDSQGGQSAAATVTITITPVNDPPDAVDDTFTVLEDSGLTTLDVLANDTIAPDTGETLSMSFPPNSPSGPGDETNNGTVVFYTTFSNQNGADSFVYIANDGNGGSDTATVSVTVTPVNDAPSFTGGGNPNVAEDGGLTTIPGWATDLNTGPSNESTQTLTFVVTENTNEALFSSGPAVASDGTLTFTPAEDAFGTATITLVVKDDGGTDNGGVDTSSAQQFFITVSPVNDAPTASSQSVSTTEDLATTITLTGSDIDGDSLTFAIGTGPTNGSLGAIGTPTCTAGSCSATVTYTPNADVTGDDSFTFTVSDGTATSAVATISITISPLADAPVAANDSYDTDGVVTLSVPAPGVLGNDTDADGNTLTAVLVSDVTGGTLTLNTDGSFSYTADAGTIADSFTYMANDGQADSNVATVTIKINALPVADAQSVSTDEDVPLSITLTASDADDENLTFAIAAGPSNGSLGTISAADCTAVNTCSATVLYTPGTNFNGTDSFTFTVNDGHAESSAATVSISITAVNDAPTFDMPTTAEALEDAGLVTLSAFATGISAGASDESSQGLTLTTTVTGTTGSLTFSQPPSINVVTGNLTFQTTANTFGTATIDVVLIDDAGTPGVPGDDLASVTQTFMLTITPVNDAPSFTPGGNVTVNEDAGAYSAAWASAVSAGPNESGQALTFTATADDTSLFSSQPAISASGTLSFTPAVNASGTTTVTVTLSDDGGTANSGVDTTAPVTFTITITAINDRPSFTAANPPAVNEDAGAQTVTGWVTSVSTGPANESGQTILAYTVSNVVAQPTLTFTTPPAVAANGTLTYTPAANAYGTATFDVVVQDNGGTANGGQDTSTVQSFTITVNAVNDAPSFAEGADQTVGEDAGAQTVNPWATGISAGPNESGQVLTFVVTTDNTGLFSSQPSVSANGTLTYTAGANKNGTATVSVKLTDDGGTANGGVNESATQTFTITVTPVNDAPTAQTKSYTAQTNMRLSIDGLTQPAGDLLDGASDPDAGDPGFTSTLTVGTVSATTPAGGLVSFNTTTGAFDLRSTAWLHRRRHLHLHRLRQRQSNPVALQRADDRDGRRQRDRDLVRQSERGDQRERDPVQPVQIPLGADRDQSGE